MVDDLRSVLCDTRRLLEQERAWDEQVLASPSEGSSIASEDQPSTAAPLSISVSAGSEDKAAALGALYGQYKDCVACPLGTTRIKFVFGVGSPQAPVMFIGEGPGYEEDRRGEPFVGKAGQLLDKILAAIHLDRTKVYIANIVKCHPMVNPQTPEARGNDRPPSTLESETCAPILKRQIAIIQPQIIVTLGSPSTRMILQSKDGITRLRGRFLPFPVDAHFGAPAPQERATLERIRVLPTYHPAALLRNPELKKDTWEDMKLLRDTLAARF